MCYFVDCVPLGSSIYCYGGEYKAAGRAGAILSDTWSLDVVNNFDLSNPNWKNVSYSEGFKPTPTAFNAMIPLLDGVSFLIHGGLTMPEVNQTTIFNTVTKQWASISSTAVTQIGQYQAVIDASGRIWCWENGGMSAESEI